MVVTYQKYVYDFCSLRFAMKKIRTPVRDAGEASTLTDSFVSQAGYWTEGEAYAISPREAKIFRDAAKSLVAAFL